MTRQTIIAVLLAGFLGGTLPAVAAEKTPPKKAAVEKVVPRAKGAVKPAPRKAAEKGKTATRQKAPGAKPTAASAKAVEAEAVKAPQHPTPPPVFYYRQKDAFGCLLSEHYVPRFVEQVQRSNEKLSRLGVSTKEGLKALERYRKAKLSAAVANDRANQGRLTEKREDVERKVCIQMALTRGQLYLRLDDHQRNLLDEIEGTAYSAPIVQHKPGFDRRSDNEQALNPEELPLRRRK